MRLLAIGIDALDPKILFEYLDEFPTFKRMVETGTSGILDGYCNGYGSYDNWASVYTGLTPREHNIIGSGASTGDVPTIHDLRGHDCLWDILNERGVTTAFIRGLMNNPPSAIDGYMLGGDPEPFHLATSSKYPLAHPRDAELAELLKGRIVDPPEPRTIGDLGTSWTEASHDLHALDRVEDDYYADFLEFVESDARYYAENIPLLHAKRPTNFMFFYVGTIDKIQHFQMHEPDYVTLRKAYRIVDDLVGELIEELQPDNTLVHSDHGQEPWHMMFPDTPVEVQQEALGWKVRAWRADGRIFCQGATDAPLAAIHCLEGVHLFSGRDVAQGVRLDGRHLIDIHPTILRFFDIQREASGVSMPVFRDDSLNRDSVPESPYRHIAVVQTLPVPATLRCVNELKMRFRGAHVTVIGHARFKPTFLHDPRISECIDLESLGSTPDRQADVASELRRTHPEFELIVVPIQQGTEISEVWL